MSASTKDNSPRVAESGVRPPTSDGPAQPDDHELRFDGLVRIFQLNGESVEPDLQHDISEITAATRGDIPDAEARRIKERLSAVRTETLEVFRFGGGLEAPMCPTGCSHDRRGG